jgi:endonuclease YncB( thermonuclease family)
VLEAITPLQVRMRHRLWLVIAFFALGATLSCGAAPSWATSTSLTCPDCPLLYIDQVVNGDTFDSPAGRVRLFGVDTPERGDKCFAESTNQLEELASEEVRVESGPRAEDSYGRLLYYAYTEDGQSIDETLVREGLALAWDRDGQHRGLLVAAEKAARQDGTGCLW